MLKECMFAFSACLFSLSIFSQYNEIAITLENVELNNIEIKAFSSLIESKKLELIASNKLNNPDFGAYYLPFGDHSSSDYTEFEIAQSFEFPSVYVARKNLIIEQQKDLEMAFESKRQEVLLAAKKSCLELIILNKTLTIEQERVAQAKQVLDHVTILFEKEQIDILTFNKAKVAWLQEQFNFQKIELQQKGLLIELKNFNGGIAIELSSKEVNDTSKLSSIESLWQEKLGRDPSLISLQQKEAIALHEIKVNKNKSLPNLAAGFNQQGFSGEYYSGFYGGITIPLFGNKTKIKAAEAKFQFQQSYSNALSFESKMTFEKQYAEYLLLRERHEEYKQVLDGLNSDTLLLEAYQLGEISFMEYFIEIQFYQQAYRVMLDMEKQYQLLKAELLKHQL